MENWELTVWCCQFLSVHWTKLLVQALCFCGKTWKCGGIFVVSHKTAWPSSLLYFVFFSVCSYWLSLCLQAQNDLASLAFIPLAFLDTALCWWISFTVLLDGMCFLFNLFCSVFFWLNFFFFNTIQVYIFFSTSGKGYRSSVIECSGQLLLSTAYLVFVELDVSV